VATAAHARALSIDEGVKLTWCDWSAPTGFSVPLVGVKRRASMSATGTP
jgi:hypothetical protein